jgi:Right handed beta helix region
VIGGNGFNGVFLFGASHSNVIAGNCIGTNARHDRGLGNGTAADFADGIFLAQFDEPEGPSNNTILGNTIAFNADSGVAIDLDATGNSASNRISRNALFGNGGVAIDLGSDGVTPNDPGDGDDGPNRRQNFPVLHPASVGAVTATLSAAPRTAFRIEFYASSRAGEGEVYLGAVVVVTGADGNSLPVRFRYAPVAGKSFLTATAINLTTGDTSEFSAAV